MSVIKYCAMELWTSKATTGPIWLLQKRFPYWKASKAPTNRSSNSSKLTFLHPPSLLKGCYRPVSSKEEAFRSPVWIISWFIRRTGAMFPPHKNTWTYSAIMFPSVTGLMSKAMWNLEPAQEFLQSLCGRAACKRIKPLASTTIKRRSMRAL